MVKNLDHVTIVVEDADAANEFFELLDFVNDHDVMIAGEKFSTYMLIPGVDARHVTMLLKGSQPRQEIQLLQFTQPIPQDDPNIARLDKLGYNHLCLAVDDIEAQAAKLEQNGVKLLNRVMLFNNRKLMYFAGPEGITLELAQWV